MRDWMVMLLMILITLPLMAQESEKNVYIHGFVSRGYLKSSGNNFLAENTKEGSFAYGEATINFTATPAEKLRIGAQLYGRDLGTNGNFYMVVDWAYGDYHWNDFLGFRLGRFKNAMGLYSKIRDVDMARVPVFLPQSTYSEGERDMNLAVDGVGIYGNINMGVMGDFEYEAVYGSYNIFDNQSSYFKEQYYNIGVEIAAGLAQNPGFLSVEYVGSSNEKVTIKDIMGLNMLWNTPLRGFKVGASFNSLTTILDFTNIFKITVPTGDPTNPTLTFNQNVALLGDYEIRTNTYFGEWQVGNFTLAGEYRRFVIDGVTGVGEEVPYSSVVPRDQYFGMAAYRVNTWLALSGYYSVFYSNKDDKDGELQVALGNPDFYAWQKDFCFTTRFDITRNWIMKAEYHIIDGTAQVSPLLNPDGMEQKWGFLALKSTFHF